MPRPDHVPACRAPTCEALEPRTLLSLAIEIDYSFDSNDFFADPARREVVEFAADWLGALLQDNLEAIIPGGPNSWTARFTHPGTGAPAEVDNPVIPEDTIRVYVGGRDLPGSSVGLGGAGGFSASGSSSFLSLVEGRGQPGAIGPDASRTDFGLWGGTISFDTATDWHVGVSASGLGSGQSDLLSIALHELVHVLGFNASTPSFANLIASSVFTGAQAQAVWNAPEFGLTGDTTGLMRWRRPSSLTQLSSVTDTPFQAITTTVRRTGDYDILSDQTNFGDAFDGVLLVYQNGFDAASPLTNLIAINNDYGGSLLPGAGPGYSGVEGLRLVAGRTYVFVVTGAADDQDGAHRLEIRRQPADLAVDGSHWVEGTFITGQEAAMDPTIGTGRRKLLTALDLAALDDIGWEISGATWPGVGAPASLVSATGVGATALRSVSPTSPGLHRFTTLRGGFIEVAATASAPVSLRLWDSAGRLVGQSEGVQTRASVVASGPSQQYTVEVIAAGAADYELAIATTPDGFALWFPEGFASRSVNETVWITNPGDEPVMFTLTMRYEEAELLRAQDTLADGRLLAPGERIGIEVSRDGVLARDVVTGQQILVERPYALVMMATGHIAASLERSDVFGGERISTSEDFVTSASRTWTFARAEKRPDEVFDFLVYYNPNPHEAIVTITALTSGGPVEIVHRVGAQRRFGLNLNDTALLPVEAFGMVVTSRPLLSADESSHVGIVAALSHFDARAGGAGWVALGQADGPTTAGVFPGAFTGPGLGARALILNTTAASATVELRSGSGAVEIVNVAPFASVVRDAPTGAGLSYSFTAGEGVVQLVQVGFGEAASGGPVTEASRNHFFAAASLDRGGASVTSVGLIGLFNPAGGAAADVEIRFSFGSGLEVTTSVSVGAGAFGFVPLHELGGLLSTSGPFSVTLRSSIPVAATLTVFDALAPVGWMTAGRLDGVLEPII
ncbi:MAG: hypothetical protein ACF8R7_12860 [Phycisphaerales bacterium JB039]